MNSEGEPHVEITKWSAAEFSGQFKIRTGLSCNGSSGPMKEHGSVALMSKVRFNANPDILFPVSLHTFSSPLALHDTVDRGQCAGFTLDLSALPRPHRFTLFPTLPSRLPSSPAPSPCHFEFSLQHQCRLPLEGGNDVAGSAFIPQ